MERGTLENGDERNTHCEGYNRWHGPMYHDDLVCHESIDILLYTFLDDETIGNYADASGGPGGEM